MIKFKKGKVVVHPNGYLVKVNSFNGNELYWISVQPDKYGKIKSGISYGKELEKFYEI